VSGEECLLTAERLTNFVYISVYNVYKTVTADLISVIGQPCVIDLISNCMYRSIPYDCEMLYKCGLMLTVTVKYASPEAKM